MTVEIKVPVLPESVADATVSSWHKKPGDSVKRDENLVDIETDKVMLEVPSPIDGILKEIVQQQGATVQAQQVLAVVEAQSGAGEASTDKSAKSAAPASDKKPETAKNTQPSNSNQKEATSNAAAANLSPSVRRMVAEKDLDVSQLSGSGKGGRLTPEDLSNAGTSTTSSKQTVSTTGERPEKRVPMTRLRARIAERLLEAQHNAAILTTFNEINMQAVMDCRQQYKDSFEKTHGVRLGFMSFFTKAAVEALKRFPAVNASLDGDDIVYHGYFDISIAVSTDRGLVVPVLRDADRLDNAGIERAIAGFAERARDGKLTIDEMTGGTFTITNGGVFGSLFATPIINPPQVAILGLQKIEERPIVENGQVVVRPMMYVALSYDHRIIDGRESVQFLKTIKELMEDPIRLLLAV